MIIHKHLIDIVQVVIFIGLFELMAIALKRVLKSTRVLRTDTGCVHSITIPACVVFPFFMGIQALWLVSYSFDKKLTSTTFLGIGGFIVLWCIAWLFTQLFIFPKWLQHLNLWLKSKDDKSLMQLIRLSIGLVMMFVVASAIVIKFQSAI